MIQYRAANCRILFAFIGLFLAFTAVPSAFSQVRTEIPHKDGTVVLVSDIQRSTSKSTYRAEGHVSITFQDIVITGDMAEYNKESGDGWMDGQVRFSQGLQWLNCSRAEFQFNSQTGTMYNASGYTDRQFWFSGHKILKTGRDTYRVEEGITTACPEKTPKWSLSASAINIRVDRTARLHNTTFRIKGIPVFYAPYLVMPLEKKERSSGFIPFHTGNSTSKGRMLREGYYQTLGKSADVLLYGDYFSLRGLALGTHFRARPNPETRFELQVYGLRDKLKQGGVRLVVDGESMLRDDWRAVARVNITSNFSFRQAFEDTFRSATVSHEKATAFLTRNHNSISTNIAYQREEVQFPARSLVIRKVPSLEFISLGTPLGRTPLILSFRTSLDGMTRMDSSMQTPNLIQRLDFNPRLTLRVPAFKGFTIVPSAGIRETYYGAYLSDDTPSGVKSDSLHRRYADLNLELRPPVLERDFTSSWFGKMQHTVEPYLSYRWIDGIKEFDKIIRFDEEDAIADTNEVEYGLLNRFFRERPGEGGIRDKQEFMSFGLIQKYYFDPSFGGAFHQNQPNAFYPLNTVTGFYQSATESNLAPISAIFRLTPQNGIQNDVRWDYDVRKAKLRNGSISTLWQQGDFYLAGTYFRSQALETGMLASNHIQGTLMYGSPVRGLASSLSISYNLRTGQLLNSNTRVNYTWNCCGVALEFNQFDLGLRTESRFSFSFTLKGIGSFGNLKRPESLF